LSLNRFGWICPILGHLIKFYLDLTDKSYGGRMLKILGLSCLIVLSLANTGCSLDSALFGVNPVPSLVYQKTQGAEIVSGSTQYRLTANNYLVSASAGSVYDKINGTTSNGYKVYLTVQGQMLSEEEQ
jgi:hypothetical protein